MVGGVVDRIPATTLTGSLAEYLVCGWDGNAAAAADGFGSVTRRPQFI